MYKVDKNKIDKVLDSINFSDKRIVNRMLHLVKKYDGVNERLNKRYDEFDKIEDELDRLLAISDFEIDVLEQFRTDVNNAFGKNIVGEIYEDYLPGISDYFSLFDKIKPRIEESIKQESIAISELNKLYSLDRIK